MSLRSLLATSLQVSRLLPSLYCPDHLASNIVLGLPRLSQFAGPSASTALVRPSLVRCLLVLDAMLVVVFVALFAPGLSLPSRPFLVWVSSSDPSFSLLAFPSFPLSLRRLGFFFKCACRIQCRCTCSICLYGSLV